MPNIATVCSPVKNFIFRSVLILVVEKGLRDNVSLLTLAVSSATFWLRSFLSIDKESNFLLSD